jgi:two-component system phosphate regulon sensor histidine kinase PhoR
LEPIIQDYILDRKVEWQLIDHKGNKILANFQNAPAFTPIKTNFKENIPPWTLELFQQSPNFLNALLSSRRSIYLYIFILITTILIFGFYLTIRMLTHELEFAKMKSNFVSAISHELKSPITSMLQMAEVLKANRVPSEERKKQYYDSIVEQGERLTFLVDNILDSARLEEGKIEYYFEKVDIKNLLKKIISIIKQKSQKDDIQISTFITKIPIPLIRIDQAAFTQLITNLVDNAIKFSDKHKKINIRLEKDENFVKIEIEDFGVGIKKVDVKKIFERFYRGENEKIFNTKGSGLGLTLVKQIVEAHQGTIKVESEFGRGSVFTVMLPIESWE